MKAKFRINTGAFNFDKVVSEKQVNGVVEEVKALPISIPSIDIDVEVEYSASEMLEMWNVTKTVANEAPEVFENFAIKLVECYYRAQKAVMPLHAENRGDADEVR